MDLDIDGDAALVTAAASDLGFASAAALAREGADVAISGHDEERLEAARADLEGIGGGDVLAERADPTDPDDLAALLEATVDAFGGLDHLVTAAPGPGPSGFLETTERRWYEVYDLLVMSVVWTIENAHPHLLESPRASIVCLTPAAVADEPAPSTAVRRAVSGLVTTLAREFAPEIRATAVRPGPIETARVEDRADRGDAGGAERPANEVPLGRTGDPAEVGSIVAVLSSPRAGYVTGVEVAVDGGLSRS